MRSVGDSTRRTRCGRSWAWRRSPQSRGIEVGDTRRARGARVHAREVVDLGRDERAAAVAGTAGLDHAGGRGTAGVPGSFQQCRPPRQNGQLFGRSPITDPSPPP